MSKVKKYIYYRIIDFLDWLNKYISIYDRYKVVVKREAHGDLYEIDHYYFNMNKLKMKLFEHIIVEEIREKVKKDNIKTDIKITIRFHKLNQTHENN